MTFMSVLRIVTVVLLGLVVAHTARVVLGSLLGQGRLPPRTLGGEILTGVGAFVIGWGLLPGGSPDAESAMMLAGSLLWAVGILIQTGKGS